MQLNLLRIKKLALIASVTLFCLGNSVSYASCNSHTDSFGNTSIRCSDGSVGYLYSDQLGNTIGRIGDRRIGTYRDSVGNTTGRIGDSSINTYSDQFGSTTGRIGDSSVNIHRDSFGNTSGKIGDNLINCYTDSFGNTNCQ